MKLSILICMLIASSCSFYETKPEFKDYALKELNKKSDTVSNANLAAVKNRLIEFAKECLAYDIVEDGGRRGGVFGKKYVPSFEQENGVISLYVFYTVEATFNSSSAYIFLAQIKEKTKKTTDIDTYFYKALSVDTEGMANRLIPWLKNEKKLCPPL